MGWAASLAVKKPYPVGEHCHITSSYGRVHPADVEMFSGGSKWTKNDQK